MINTPEGLHSAARRSAQTLQRKDINHELSPAEARVPKWHANQRSSDGQEPWKILNQSGRGLVPRCDGCRENRLKCDRVLPRCNQCKLVPNQGCVYTPPSSSNFRGMPRCERCREMNLLQCDRETPCGTCTQDKASCAYTTPDRPRQNHGSVTSLVTTTATSVRHTSIESSPNRTKFDTSQHGKLSGGGGLYTEDEESSDFEPRFTRRSDVALSPNSEPLGVIPWTNPAFAALPPSILETLARIPVYEMPTRSAYNDTLGRFILSLPRELAETSLFPPDNYSKLHDALKARSAVGLSDTLVTWVSVHRVQVGSNRQLLLIMLSDTAYHLDAHDQRRERIAYISRTDMSQEHVFDDTERTFDRLPVSSQIYDLLTWAHREHNCVSSMLKEVQRAGFATITPTMAILYMSLCPVCNTSAKYLRQKIDNIDE